jgi:hypothetical protein
MSAVLERPTATAFEDDARDSPRRHRHSAFGALAQYANPSLWDQEADAWKKAAVEKYVSR